MCRAGRRDTLKPDRFARGAWWKAKGEAQSLQAVEPFGSASGAPGGFLSFRGREEDRP